MTKQSFVNLTTFDKPVSKISAIPSSNDLLYSSSSQFSGFKGTILVLKKFRISLTYCSVEEKISERRVHFRRDDSERLTFSICNCFRSICPSQTAYLEIS